MSAEHEAETVVFSKQELEPSEEAEALVDPLEPFADEAENRMEQDLLMMANGFRRGRLQRRFQRYLKYCADPILSTTAVVLKYKEQVDAVVFTPAEFAQHAPC